MLKKWDEIPDFMKCEEVKFYYDILLKKKLSIKVKRIFDIALASFMLIILAVPMIIISIMIKIDSQGPVFYRQERITAYGKKFRIHKFRTMVNNADKIGTSVTIDEDSRITIVGSKLRSLRIDEIPQLLDVLSGNMSFVGTRPEATKYVEKYTKEMRATLLLPAGITSEASIRYKDEAKLLRGTENIDDIYVKKILPKKMKYNLESIRRFSLIEEVKTIFRTVLAVLGVFGMNNIKVEDLQNKMLEMLLYFDEFCRENSLKYYVCGGCLIGVVRHKGFIPWDDDIDLFMPRPDYERLAKIWNKKADIKKFVYCRTNREHIYHDGGASIRDIRTTYINRHSVNEDIEHGIALEIMPIDGCPTFFLSRWRQIINAFVFSLFNVQRLPDNKGKTIRVFSELIYKVVPSKNIRYKIWKHAEKEMTKYKWEDCQYVTELIGSIKGMLIRHPKQDFNKVILKEFEGYQIPVMAGYKRYLKEIWGDYMQLPPEEKRVAKHDVVYMDLNEPYTKFKGIYYCNDKR